MTRRATGPADIVSQIDPALDDLGKVIRYAKLKLADRDGVQSIAAQIIASLEATKKRLVIAKVQCVLMEPAIGEVRDLAEQYGLLN